MGSEMCIRDRSNTEPIIRIYAEALSEEIATQLIKKVKDQIGVS